MKKDNLKILERSIIELAKENNMDLNLIRCYDNIIVEFKSPKTDGIDEFVNAAMNISSKVGFQEYLDISTEITKTIESNSFHEERDSIEEYIQENQLSMF